MQAMFLHRLNRFFFSSRRRHTRYIGDWSSDVCSSDLAITAANKTYDGTSSATITCALTGVIGGDLVTCSGTGSFASAAVGTAKTVTASDLTLSGAAAGNYALSSTTATTTANITAATSPSVTLSPDPAAVGAPLTATVSNGPGNARDWIGLFPETADDGSYVAWCYLY